MVTRYFKSRFSQNHKKEWEDIIKALGINVYDVMVPSELYVILGGTWENPTAFHDKKTIVFYKKDVEWPTKNNAIENSERMSEKHPEVWEDFENRKQGLFIDILSHYYDTMIDLTGMNTKDSADKIRGEIEAYKS